MRLFFVALVLMCAGNQVIAQDVQMYATLPDSIVITATRYQEHAQSVGQRIEIWDADDIAQLPVSSFDELLRMTGGVEVFSRSGFGVQSDITIRGGTFNGILMLIDGIRFNDAQTGHFLSDFPIPLSQIERIEILRGPTTVVFGPDALNGVVHVITKAAASNNVPEGLQLMVGSQLGSHQSRNATGDLQYGKRNWRVGMALEYQGTDGETITDDAGAIVGPRGVVKTDFERFAHSLYFRTGGASFQLFARVAQDWRDFNAFHFYTLSSLDFSREATETTWGQLRLNGKLPSNTEWAINTVAKLHRDEFDFNPEFPNNEHTSRHFVVRSGLRHDISPQLMLSTGLTGWWRDIDSNNLGKHNDFTVGGYVHTRFQPAEDLVLYSGFRIDHDGAFGTELTPQINAVYRIGRFALRGNLGRAVRAPNYVEQYINFTRSPQRDRNYGNPDLRVEKAWSKEIGFDLYPTEFLTLNTTLFQRNTSNLIDFAQTNPIVGAPMLSDSVLLAQNIASVQTSGLEFDARIKKQWGSQRLDFITSFSRLTTDLDEVKAGAVFKYASNHARNFVQSTLQWQSSYFQIGVQAFWKERLDDENYGIFNVRAAVPFQFSSSQLLLSVDVRNVFDVSYAEVLDAPMPGRWILFGATLRR